MSPHFIHWAGQVPEDQWAVYQEIIQRVNAAGLSFAVGGAFGVAAYTGRWRNTKDLDIYVVPEDRQAVIRILTESGLTDYYDVLPYDREWIYRSHKGETIIDIIWSMANQRAQVDDAWLTRGPVINVHGKNLQVIPAEELLWAKLYVMQKERSDWPDVLNIIYTQGDALDWAHLLDRLAEDAPLLAAALTVFGWLDPVRARQLPTWLWQQLRILRPMPVPSAIATAERRAHRLDTRPWFVPLIHEDENQEA